MYLKTFSLALCRFVHLEKLPLSLFNKFIWPVRIEMCYVRYESFFFSAQPQTFLPRSPAMSDATGQLKTIGANINSRAILVVHSSECRRTYGPRFKLQHVKGTRICADGAKKRNITYLEVDWQIGCTVMRTSVYIASVKATASPSNDNNENQTSQEEGWTNETPKFLKCPCKWGDHDSITGHGNTDYAQNWWEYSYQSVNYRSKLRNLESK